MSKYYLFKRNRGINLIYIHVMAIILGLIALYLSFRSYNLFGRKTKRWFIFNLFGFLLLSLVHAFDVLDNVFVWGVNPDLIMLVEHILFFTAMISFILSYWIMINSFRKSFPKLFNGE